MAVQTLLAREIASGRGDETDPTKATMRAKRVRHLINGSIFVGGLVAGGLSLLTFFQKESVLRGLTTDAGIREASRVIFPVVLVTQGERLSLINLNKSQDISDISISHILLRYFTLQFSKALLTQSMASSWVDSIGNSLWRCVELWPLKSFVIISYILI